jgi:hypothetical protein
MNEHALLHKIVIMLIIMIEILDTMDGGLKCP